MIKNMIETDITITKKEREEYTPLPEDVYQVELLDITAKENETYDSREAKKKDPNAETVMESILNFRFALLGGEDLRGRNIFVNYVPTYLYIGKNGKNKLYQIVEALLGRELTPEEEVGSIDTAFLNGLIGKQCRIGTKNKVSGDKTYSNADSFYKSETDGTPLNEEERASQFKSKEETQEDVNKELANDIKNEDTINPDDIPF